MYVKPFYNILKLFNTPPKILSKDKNKILISLPNIYQYIPLTLYSNITHRTHNSNII